MISIITITYNRSKLLKVAISSVLSQSYKDYEYIIVDDGSTDNTKEIVEQFKDERIIYIFHPNTGYLSRARNCGLDKARGSIVAFLDSDDYWNSEYLLELTKIYANKNYSSVISNAFVFSEEKQHRLLNPDKLNALEGSLIEDHYLNDNLIIYPSCFSFKFSGVERLNPNLKHGENDLILKLLATSNSFISLKELVYIRKHEGNISSEKTYNSLLIKGYFEEYTTLDYLLQKNLISASLYNKAYSHYHFKHAENFYSLGLKGKAWNMYLKSFLKYPFKIKALARLLKFYRFI